MKKDISENTKKELLNSLIYQAGMMRRCFYRCIKSSSQFPDSNGGVDEDLMVAFLVHVRVFYYFFFDSRNKNEAYAGDYLNWKINDSEMEKWCKQINRYLLHLDSKRPEGEYRPYNIIYFYIYFRRLIIDFINKLPKKFITSELTELSEELKKENQIIKKPTFFN